MTTPDLGNLSDLAKQMSDAYAGGTAAINQADSAVAKDMKPDHIVELEIEIKANVEGHDYKVDAQVAFDIELDPILQLTKASKSDLSAALDDLDVDLGADKGAVMEQLGQPRAVGVVKKIKAREVTVFGPNGAVKAKLNKEGTLLATLKDGTLLINCESVFSFPDDTDLFYAVPSMEKMQEHIVVPVKEMSKKKTFSWKEKDKDNLSVSGSIKIKRK